MSARKLRNSWWVDFRVEGVRYRKRSPENSQTGAKAYEALLRHRLAHGEPLERSETVLPSAPRFDSFADEWLRTYVTPNNKPATLRGRQQLLRAHLVPWFRSRRLDEISTQELEEYKAAKQAAGLAPATINKDLATLRKLLQTAVDWGRLAKVPKVKLLRETPTRLEFLAPEECDRLLSVHSDATLHAMVLLALRTGMRVGELRALEWPAVDLGARTVTVRAAFSADVLTSPKNNKVRHIPLTDEVCGVLRGMYPANGFVFSRRPGQAISYFAAVQGLRALCVAADLRRVGWHLLRHTFCSHLVQRGVPLPAVQLLLGHADLRMTLRYAHLAPSTLRDAVMMLEQCDPKNLGHAVGNAPARASETGEPVMPEIGSTKPTSRPTGFSLAA